VTRLFLASERRRFLRKEVGYQQTLLFPQRNLIRRRYAWKRRAAVGCLQLREFRKNPQQVLGSLLRNAGFLKPITQLLPRFILIKADPAHTLALHNTMQALASEMAEQAPGSEVVTTRLAEVLFIQALRAHIASEVEWRNKGWLRAIFDPQVGAALSAVHDSVSTPWTVESLAAAATMSRSAFAVRFKELLGQTPLEYVTEWRMQKAMQLLQQRDKKLIDVARSVGYESDAAFSKAFKRVVGANPGEYLKRGFEGHGNAGMAEDF
jgi:AraC-like DNA-binding protein